jgi:hypothetical protein
MDARQFSNYHKIEKKKKKKKKHPTKHGGAWGI